MGGYVSWLTLGDKTFVVRTRNHETYDLDNKVVSLLLTVLVRQKIILCNFRRI